MRFFKMSLALKMAVATFLGAACGLFFGDLCNVFSPYASAYILVLKVTAVPYLIVAIMHGLGQLSASQALQILRNGVLFIGLAWVINILMVYLTYSMFPLPSTKQIAGYTSIEPAHLNFADLLIPDNIFFCLTNNIVPAIVVFSVFFGIALMFLKRKEVIMQGLENLVEVLTSITGWIARITPYGTFLIIANQVGTIQLSTVKQVSTYVILYLIGVCLVIFWIFPRLVSMLTNIRSYKWIQQLSPVLLLGYTTNVVIVCLPYIIELLKKETQVIDPKDEKAQAQIQGTVSVVFNLPLGSLFITLFVLFVSIFYSIPLNFNGQVELFVTTFLTGLGAVGLGSWINNLTFILDSLSMPIEAVNLYLSTLPFTAGFQSMVSVMQIASLSLFITLSCRKMIQHSLARILRSSFITLIPVLAVAAAIKLVNPLPDIKKESKSIFELDITSTSPAQILTAPPSPRELTSDLFDQIVASKVLRVGYYPEAPPYCFYNIQGSVVGYDMAFAYELAYDLGCHLELVPLHYESVINELTEGQYDIAMSAVSVTPQRLKELLFSRPYVSSRLVLVVQEKMRKAFSTLSSIQENSNLKIAVMKGSSYEMLAREYFPENRMILLNTYGDIVNEDATVALLWEEEEAMAWSLTNRGYRLVLPSPALGVDQIAYAVREGNLHLVSYLNEWMAYKRGQGFVKKQYDLWIKGKTEIAAAKEPRWSIIRNVLHWVE